MMRTPRPLDPCFDITRATLRSADYTFAQAFSLKLADSTDSFMGEKILRMVPAKRMVAFGYWQGKASVAKIFFGAQAKKQMQRDLDGSTALIAAKIPSPAILYAGQAAEKTIYVIIFAYIENAESMDDFWQSHQKVLLNDASSPDDSVLEALTVELATHHVLGFLQEDLHLKNFLKSGDKIYTLDGGDIKTFPGPLSKKQSIENLALFFSQLGMYSNPLQKRLFDLYVKSRGWLVKRADLVLLQTTIRHYNRQRWSDFTKKIFRSCSAFGRIKTFKTYVLYDRKYVTPALMQCLKNPAACFNQSDAVMLKAGKSSTVIKVPMDQHDIVIKRYNIKNFIHRVKRLFTPSRALLSWQLANQLHFVGLPTAKPVAVIQEKVLGFLPGKAYFLMEHIEGVSADKVLSAMDESTQQMTAKNIISIFFNLARLRLSHGDLKITNILLNKNNEPFLIDLDGMRQHQSSLSLWHRFRKDMERFLENWQENPGLLRLFKEKIKEWSEV